MGEIKSTLDLVMERTRHLSLSAEEKEAQRREDFAKRLQGLLQQYADEAMTAEALHEGLAALQTELKLRNPEGIAAAVLERIDPDRENLRWLALLEHLAPEACRPLQDLLKTHRRKREQELLAARQGIIDRLADHDDIRGSAVIPNPGKNAACQEKLADLQKATRAKIEVVARNALPSG
jgi:hypothetical protein